MTTPHAAPPGDRRRWAAWWEELADLPREMLTFAAIGVAGLLVDTVALYLVTFGVGFDRYSGRVFSYLVAATFTWWANRTWTFTDASRRGAIRQWARFLIGNAPGGLVNYLMYATLVTFNAAAHNHPVLGIAAGSLAGMVFNFTVSKLLVFRKEKPPISH